MKYFNIFFTILFIANNLQSYNSTLLYNLQAIQTDYINDKNNAYGQTLKKGFQSFYKLSKNCGPMAILQHNAISNLFLLSPQKNLDSQFNQYLKNSQNIMLVYLYSKLFQDYIAQTQDLIEQALNSLDYWEIEKFYDKLPTLRKHPIYWYHSPAQKKSVCNHAQVLKKLTDEATLLLGIALHGQHQLLQIQDSSDLEFRLLQAIEPLNKHFQTLQLPNSEASEALFQNTIWIHQNIQTLMQNHQAVLQTHAQPHHIIRHGFLYSCIALTAIGTYALYKKHEINMPRYQEKTIEAWNYFLKEYIQEPAAEVKDALWDQQNQKLIKLKKPDNLPTEHSFKTWLIDSRLNSVFVWFNQIVGNLFDCANQNFEVMDKSLKQQQLTIAMAAIAPAALGAFGAYYGTKSIYLKHIKHESWYKPMQMIVREIDKTLNKLTSQNHVSFADDGMMHVLTRRLKTYISCLPNEELQLIQQDLQELSAYHLNYQQKRGVLDRMYRTYEFLK
ncbi:hypothetical protein KBB68_01440 [Candidatus Babeliales bacterium]|nr:hypothetical protein [Candidatus Babeliales bacterium]